MKLAKDEIPTILSRFEKDVLCKALSFMLGGGDVDIAHTPNNPLFDYTIRWRISSNEAYYINVITQVIHDVSILVYLINREREKHDAENWFNGICNP